MGNFEKKTNSLEQDLLIIRINLVLLAKQWELNWNLYLNILISMIIELTSIGKHIIIQTGAWDFEN